MNTDDKVIPIARRATRSFSFVGWQFLVVGTLFVIQPARDLFDPHATVQVNDVTTSDFTTKLGVACLLLIFPLIGGFFALTPKSTLERWFAAFIHWSRAFAAWSRR